MAKGNPFFKVLVTIVIIVLAVVMGVNFLVVGNARSDISAFVTGEEIEDAIEKEESIGTAAADSGQGGIITAEKLEALRQMEADCILVLGAGVKPDGSPTLMLKDRLEVGLYLYRQGIAKKLLLSGDNGQIEYNEVKCMREYMQNHGVPDEDIFLDHAGFSTYESMYRAKDIFQVRTAVVVTQSYHEYRALYIGKRLGLEVTGVAADQWRYGGQFSRDVREVIARDKDFVKCLYKPEPTFLGESIPISGNGTASW